MPKKTRKSAPLYETIDRSTGKPVHFSVVIVDDIQWGITRGKNVVSYHAFSDSLRRRWRELTVTDLPITLPRKRADAVKEQGQG